MNNPPILYYNEMESPIGPLLLCRSDDGLCHMDFGTFAGCENQLREWAGKWYGKASLIRDREALAPICLQLDDYFAARRQVFDLPVDLRGTDFQLRVWEALRRIPYGETRSYKQVGEAIGSPKAVRAVGGANNRNPVSIIIPCHRVIGATGEMVGYGGGLPIKRFLLELETRGTAASSSAAGA